MPVTEQNNVPRSRGSRESPPAGIAWCGRAPSNWQAEESVRGAAQVWVGSCS
jgi:hypothetical protein